MKGATAKNTPKPQPLCLSPKKKKGKVTRELMRYTCLILNFLKKRKTEKNSMFSSLLYE
jgi:hypothetical protein